MPTDIAIRRAIHYQLNSHFAQCDNRQLLALLTPSKSLKVWNDNQTLRVGRTKVFVKRVPVTPLEYDNPHSTKNHYRLPTYYNYGVGSVGFGIYREILAHIKTTNWVLEGAMPHFPLMYHHRIVPCKTKTTALPDWYDGYINHWNGNKRVDEMMRQRLQAPYEALIFLEHIPQTLHNWLPRNLEQTDRVILQAGKTLAFLRQQGLRHFDCHFHNILTDGTQIYLTDFGLALDSTTPMNRREKDFYNRHADFDCGQFLNGLGYYFMDRCLRLSERRRGEFYRQLDIPKDISRGDLFEFLLANIETVHKKDALKLPAQYVKAVARYRPIIDLIHHFFSDLHHNRRKNTLLDHVALRRLLKAAKFP